MVDIYSLWTNLIKGLNNKFTSYTYVKANQDGNLPDYPFATVNLLNPYIQDKDDIRGTIIRQSVEGDDTKVHLTRTEEPKMVFSFDGYSDDLQQCLQLLKDTVEWLIWTNQRYLESCGIVVLGCSKIADRTTFIEVDYQYHWGFDLTIRVNDSISMNVDSIGSVDVENKNK
jgi:hypothetical protein